MENKKELSIILKRIRLIYKKKKRNGFRIENISAKLLIKKTILKNIENGLFNQKRL